jgi:ankyrin repeat protein
LLAAGADVNGRDDERGVTPLFFAVATGHRTLVGILLAKGADINAKGYEGVTPLYIAAKLDRTEVAELLVAHGAEVDSRTKSGHTPLTMAATQGNREIVELLIISGADVNVRDITGKTPLLWAIAGVMLASPLEQARLSVEDRQAVQKEIQKMKGEWQEVALLLIAHGANTNAISEGYTPLSMAANVGDKDLVETLIEHGADIDYSAGHETALHAAIAEKHRDVAELLIIKGANVNVKNLSGRTTLHFLAAHIDDRKLAELMIEHGANINARDKDGTTPLTFATNAQNNQVAEVIKERGGK